MAAAPTATRRAAPRQWLDVMLLSDLRERFSRRRGKMVSLVLRLPLLLLLLLRLLFQRKWRAVRLNSCRYRTSRGSEGSSRSGSCSWRC